MLLWRRALTLFHPLGTLLSLITLLCQAAGVLLPLFLWVPLRLPLWLRVTLRLSLLLRVPLLLRLGVVIPLQRGLEVLLLL